MVQTHGGPEFKAEFVDVLPTWRHQHRIASPYKKNEQICIESFDRTRQSECLGCIRYQSEQIDCLIPYVEEFRERYHYHRPHLAIEPMNHP